MKAQGGGVEVQIHSFFTSALDEVNGQLYAPDSLPSGNKPDDLEALENRQMTLPCCQVSN